LGTIENQSAADCWWPPLQTASGPPGIDQSFFLPASHNQKAHALPAFTREYIKDAPFLPKSHPAPIEIYEGFSQMPTSSPFHFYSHGDHTITKGNTNDL